MSVPLRTFIDGAAVDATWTQDRAFLYGDGLFETLRVIGGRICFEADHQSRLAQGCERLRIAMDLDAVWRFARAVAAEQGDATLRLQVTRGEATARGYTPSGQEQARSVLAVHPAPSVGEMPARVHAVTLAQQLGENPALAGLKHCNRLEQVLARLALRETGAFEGLMASSSGLLISGTMSNVFLELDGELVTPAVDRCGVAGVMRAAVLREAQRRGQPVRVATLPLTSLTRCTALALSNARMGLVPVHTLDARALATGSRLHELAARMNTP